MALDSALRIDGSREVVGEHGGVDPLPLLEPLRGAAVRGRPLCFGEHRVDGVVGQRVTERERAVSVCADELGALGLVEGGRRLGAVGAVTEHGEHGVEREAQAQHARGAEHAPGRRREAIDVRLHDAEDARGQGADGASLRGAHELLDHVGAALRALDDLGPRALGEGVAAEAQRELGRALRRQGPQAHLDRAERGE